MFWYLNEVKGLGLRKGTYSDEMFVILGRTLMNKILSKKYCYQDNEQTCASLNQHFDTNAGGQSLGLWLSSIKDVSVLPLNDVALHKNKFLEFNKFVDQPSNLDDNDLKTNVLVNHLSRDYNKDPSLIQQKYDQCY